jgi:hypothetical protein
MVYKIGGYIIIYEQARKLAPKMPQNGGLLGFGYLLQMFTNTKLLRIAEPLSIRWPENTENEAFMLIRVGHEESTASATNNFTFEELPEDREVKTALEKRLCESISEFTTMTHPHRGSGL